LEESVPFSLENYIESKGLKCESLLKARELSVKRKSELTNIVKSKRLYDEETAMVFYGSLARGEMTDGSDLDWTLLIDGQAKVVHEKISASVGEAIEDNGFGKPSGAGFFGNLTYSHDLVHYIGGEDDTNEIISKRMLYLLESGVAQAGKGQDIHNRVALAIIDQYIALDSTYASKDAMFDRFPRLLLNDMVRFWRTMCVDFAYKSNRDRGRKWALRNIKLRMSRKLLFVKGLLMCYTCFENPKISTLEELRAQLRNAVEMKPLDFMVSVLVETKIPDDIICEIINAYNKFLALLNDGKTREKLEKIPMRECYSDQDFIDARANAAEFQQNLTKAFFFDGSQLKKFTIKYSIF
jgi:hypothetical protein